MKKNHLPIAFVLLLSILVISCDTKTDPTDSDGGTDSTKASTISGQVVSALTGKNLSGAIIKISDGISVRGTTSDVDGKFSYNFELDNDTDLSVIVFKSGYFRDTTTVFGIVNSTVEVPTFKLERDESSNAGDFSGRAASIYLIAQTSESVGVKETGALESMQITFEIMDSSGIVIGDNNAIDVSFRFGSTPGGGEYLYPASIRSNSLGRVNVSLNTGTKAGVSQIIAEAVVDGNPITSKPIMIAIHGGFPDAAHFSIGPKFLNYPYYNIFNGKAEITVLVGDKYSNFVKEGTSVYFNSEAGVIEGSAVTNKFGNATVTLLSGNPIPFDEVLKEGYFYVHSTTVDEDEKYINTKTLVLFSSTPVVTLSPTSIDIKNAGSQNFSYTVSDIFGNPLAHGNNFAVVVETAGKADASGDISITMPDRQFGVPTYFFTVFDKDVENISLETISVRVISDGPNGRATSNSATGLTR